MPSPNPYIPSTHRQADRLRATVKARALIDVLQRFCLGLPARKVQAQPDAPALKLSREQVQAALGLLRKVLPDMQAVEISGDVELKRMSDEELRARALALLGQLQLEAVPGLPAIEGQSEVLTTNLPSMGVRFVEDGNLAVADRAGRLGMIEQSVGQDEGAEAMEGQDSAAKGPSYSLDASPPQGNTPPPTP